MCVCVCVCVYVCVCVCLCMCVCVCACMFVCECMWAMNDVAHGAPVSTYSMHKHLQLVGYDLQMPQ